MLQKYLQVILISISLAWSAHSFAQQAVEQLTIQEKYSDNRANYLKELDDINNKYEVRTKEYEANINKTQETLSDSQQEVDEIQKRTREANQKNHILDVIINGIVIIFYPLLGSASVFASMVISSSITKQFVLIATPLLLANLFLYTVTKEKQIFSTFKIPILFFIILFAVMYSLPSIADETDEKKLIEKLATAQDILSKNDHQKFISILESKIDDNVNLPELTSNDSYLKPFRHVIVDSAEYYFTLAALYIHENQKGNAREALKRIAENENISFYEESDTIINNTIRYLFESNGESIGTEMVANHVAKIDSVSILLDLSNYLTQKGMLKSEDFVLNAAIKKAISVDELLELGEFFIKRNDQVKAFDAFSKASKNATVLNELLDVTRAALEHKDEASLTTILERLPDNIDDYSENLIFVDLLIEKNRRETALDMFKKMIKRVKKSSDFQESLLYLANAALDREFTAQAVDALQKLSVYLGSGLFDYKVYNKLKLPEFDSLPDKTKTKLPHAYGLINEKMNFDDKAQDIYIKSVLHSLDRVLENYGYDLPDELNSYHLLGNSLKKSQNDLLLEKLDSVYTLLEKQRLKDRTAILEQTLRGLETEQDKLIRENESALAEIARFDDQLATARKDSILLMFRQLAIIFVYIIALIAIAYNAWRFCLTLSDHKFFGFNSKFTESLGWVKVMSVFAIPSGVILIWIGQFLLIFQKNQEYNYIGVKKIIDENAKQIKQEFENEL